MNKVEERIMDDKYGLKTITLVIWGFLLLLSQLVSSFIVDMSYKIFRVGNSFTLFFTRGFLDILLFLLAFFFLKNKVLKVKPSYFRIEPFKISLKWLVVALGLPFSVIGFYFIFAKGNISYGNNYSLATNIMFALKLGLVASIIEEFLFRGYLMKILEVRWNKAVAVIVPSIIFALLHTFKSLDTISFFQLLISLSLVGIMFSVMTLYTNSIWPAVLLHATWNITVIGIFRISELDTFRSVINYQIFSNNRLLTGGDYGIECALPAIIGYAIVILVAIRENVKKPVINVEK